MYIALLYNHVFHRLTSFTNLAMLLTLLMIKGEQLAERIWHNNKLPTGHNVNRVVMAVALQGDDTDLGGGLYSSNLSFHIHLYTAKRIVC